jgi:hypothetical protein
LSGSALNDFNTANFANYKGRFTLNRVWWQGSNGPYSVSSLAGPGRLRLVQRGVLSTIAPAGQLLSAGLNGADAADAMIGYATPTSRAGMGITADGGVGGKTYRWRARVKLVGVTGPRRADDCLWGGAYGLVLHASTSTPPGETWP